MRGFCLATVAILVAFAVLLISPPSCYGQPIDGPMELTAYSHTGHRTASGSWPVAGVTLACPHAIPFGTWLEIEGIGRRRCEDRGGAIRFRRLDLFMDSEAEAIVFGRQTRMVRVVVGQEETTGRGLDVAPLPRLSARTYWRGE